MQEQWIILVPPANGCSVGRSRLLPVIDQLRGQLAGLQRCHKSPVNHGLEFDQ